MGILLSTGKEHPNSATASALIRTGLSKGIDIYLYLIDDGVTNIEKEDYARLSDRGVKLFVCAYSCQRRGIPRDDRFTYCGLVVLSELVNTCDRFIPLN